MSIQSDWNNFWTNAGNAWDQVKSWGTTQLENIVGTVSTGLSNIWDGGFSGISESGIEEVITILEKYCSDIEGQIALFNEEGEIANAYKGEIQDAAREFIIATKKILQAYVSTMKVSIQDARVAYQNYASGAQQISQNVRQDAQEVEKEAAQVRLD